MNEDIIKELVDFGLKEKEAKIFTFLVGKDELTAYNIAKNLGYFRSTTYEILDKLIEKGFVTKSSIKNTFFYKSNSIHSIISKLKSKEDILSSLSSKLNYLNIQKPSTRILIGDEGQKQYNFELTQIIKDRKISHFYMIGNSPPLNESSLIFIEKIINEIKKIKKQPKDIFKGLWNEKYVSSKFIDLYKNFGENKFLKSIQSEAVAIISDNFVGFFFEEEKTSYVIEIKSKVIANEMKSYFDIMWNIAKIAHI